MTLPLLLALLAGGAGPAVHLSLPLPEGREEAVAVMMPGGMPPADPWGSLNESQRELLWVLGCRGAQVNRTSWSGYLLVCPRGASGALLELADTLASGPVRDDGSAWAGALDLRPGDGGRPAVLRFCPEGADTAGDLPVRVSRMLSGPPDTVVLTGPWPNSAILWSHRGDDAYASSWRGLGTETVATEGGCFPAGVCLSVSGSPAALEDLLDTQHPLDAAFAAGWGGAMGLVEEAVESSRGGCRGDGHLLWMRGLGGGDTLRPWSAEPMPSPWAYPARLPELPEPVEPFGLPVPLRADSTTFRMRLAAGGSDDPLTAAACALIERLAGSLALREVSGVSSVWLAAEGDSLWLEGSADAGDPSAADSLLAHLRVLALAPPSHRMVESCAARASYIIGERIEPPERVRLLERAVGMLEEAGGD
ncbi:MAG: hypothetical protein R6U36_08645 [Candidatus Fermentibacteraceae bacterium]